MANGDLFEMSFVPESTYGETPAAGSWETMRLVSDGMSGEPQTTESEEIAGTEVGVSDVIFLGLDVTGDIPIEFSATTYDAVLEAVLGGTWAGGALQGGSIARSFTLQGYQPDLVGDKYVSRPGTGFSGMQLTFNVREKVSGSISAISADEVIAASSAVGGGSLAAATTTDVMKTGASVTGVKVDGSAVAGLRVQSIALNIQREQEEIRTVDSLALKGLFARTLRPEISVTTYFDNFDFYTKALASTAFSFEWTITDGTTAYTFHMAKCKISSGAPDGAQKGQSRVHTWTALGLKDATSSPLKITKA
jgi:hypothetical protein